MDGALVLGGCVREGYDHVESCGGEPVRHDAVLLPAVRCDVKQRQARSFAQVGVSSRAVWA